LLQSDPAAALTLTTPKITKQIRFNLGSGHTDTSDLLTPTPPPKEFKRLNSQRKTLRNTRCLSTVVTDRERAQLFDEFRPAVDSPKAPQGSFPAAHQLLFRAFGPCPLLPLHLLRVGQCCRQGCSRLLSNESSKLYLG
jgi:hypothetical protein